MQHFSDELPLVLVGSTAALAGVFKAIYEDLFKSWALKLLAELGLTPMDSTIVNGFMEIVPELLLATGVVYFLYRYLKRDFEHKRAEFIRDLALPRGDEGYYTAYVNVKNTNSTEKLKDVRCEIHKLISVDSGLIYNSIVLRTKDQDDMEVNGRFKIDQDSFKEIPVFYIDQSRDDDSGVRVISADKNDIHLPHNTYLATLRCFGDKGKPDEITVCINTNTCEYVLVERPEKAQPFLDHNLIESKKP